jgi:hypothetical protein
MSTSHDGRTPSVAGAFELHVVRRHVDLLRVNSALCRLA